MDDFSVFGHSFDQCLQNLILILQRCVETNLVLNWEKCYFMVQEVIILGYRISQKGIKVDKAKIDIIERLPPPSSVRGVRAFLGMQGFIEDLLRISPKLQSRCVNYWRNMFLFTLIKIIWKLLKL